MSFQSGGGSLSSERATIPWAMALASFDDGRLGASTRALRLSGLTPRGAHERLLAAGFWPQRIPIAGPISRTGERQWRTLRGAVQPIGLATHETAYEDVYVHADGGVVRIWHEVCPVRGLAVLPGACARKSVLLARPEKRAPSELGFDQEAFVVTEQGNPLPKCPRVDHGLRNDPTDPSGSHALARAGIVASRTRLEEGPPAEIPFAIGARGLSRSFTLIPPTSLDFGVLYDQLLVLVEMANALPREDEGDLTLFFVGDPELAERLRREAPRTGLASLCIHRGSFVLSVEPFGYEQSVGQLAEMVLPLLAAEGFRVFEDATGRDLTLVAQRFPSRLFGPDPPPVDMHIDAV